MTVEFRQEKWADYAEEARALWPVHWHELYDGRLSAIEAARTRMKINETWFERVEALDALVIVTARDQGALVGYVIFTLGYSSHYADVMCAHDDTIYVSPEHRKGLLAGKMIRFAEGVLKERGVHRVYLMSNEVRPLGKLFRFLRYRHTHAIYSRWIG